MGDRYRTLFLPKKSLQGLEKMDRRILSQERELMEGVQQRERRGFTGEKAN